MKLSPACLYGLGLQQLVPPGIHRLVLSYIACIIGQKGWPRRPCDGPEPYSLVDTAIHKEIGLPSVAGHRENACTYA